MLIGTNCVMSDERSDTIAVVVDVFVDFVRLAELEIATVPGHIKGPIVGVGQTKDFTTLATNDKSRSETYKAPNLS